MLSKMAFFAAHELRAGSGEDAYVTHAGTQIDEAEARKLGLSYEDVEALVKRGAIVQQRIRAGADDDENAVEGISVDEFRDFLIRNHFTVDDDATVDDMLALTADPETFDGLLASEMSGVLTERGIAHDPDASAEDLFAIALGHGVPEDVDTVANRIERELKVEEIRAELEKLQVPFAPDANKQPLARLLAQVRATAAPAV